MILPRWSVISHTPIEAPGEMIEVLRRRPGNTLETKSMVYLLQHCSPPISDFPVCIKRKWPYAYIPSRSTLFHKNGRRTHEAASQRTVQLQDVSSKLGTLLLSLPSLPLS